MKKKPHNFLNWSIRAHSFFPTKKLDLYREISIIIRRRHFFSIQIPNLERVSDEYTDCAFFSRPNGEF